MTTPSVPPATGDTNADSAAPTLLTSQYPWWRSAVVLGIALLLVATCLISGRPKGSSEPGVIMDLPYKVADYWGSSEGISQAEKLVLPPDTVIERKDYDSLTGDKVLCSIVLSGVERRSIHRPEICLPGQGWTIGSSTIIPVKLNSGKELSVTRLLLYRDVPVAPGRTQRIQSIYYYWFVGKNFTTPSHLVRVFYSSWDLLFHNLNHRWAYVIVTSIVSNTVRSDGKNIEQTDQMLQDFMRLTVPKYQVSEMSPEDLQKVSPLTH